MIVETERLIIRQFDEQDIDALYEMNRDPKILTYIPTEPFTDISQAQALYFDVVLPNYEKYGYGRWAIYHKKDAQVIGFCGPKYIDEMDEVEIGYRLLPKYWGAGIATEAFQSIIPVLHKYGINEVVSLILFGNEASESVAKKSGLIFREQSRFMNCDINIYHRNLIENLEIKKAS